jgi:hypothetical protein
MAVPAPALPPMISTSLSQERLRSGAGALEVATFGERTTSARVALS